MLTVTSILGNTKKDPTLNQKYEELSKKNTVENVTIQRSESEKVRMRKTSNKGTDVGFILPSRTRLRDRDVVFLDDDKIILIELSPELVAVLSFKVSPLSSKYAGGQNNNSDFINMAIKIGHTIGNLHRPLKLEENKIIFPIQSMDEIDLFLRLLPHIKDHIAIKTDNMIFEPDHGFDIHEH
jgi:urease accessory protein